MAALGVLLATPQLIASDARADGVSKAELARFQAELNRHRHMLAQLGELNRKYGASLSEVLATSKTSRGRERGRGRSDAAEAAVTASASEVAAAEPSSKAGVSGKGTIVGKVKVKGGKAGDTWLYIEDIAAPASKATATMAQVDKQFAPQVLVVQKGTKVSFPNGDPIFHNVFSLTPGSPFDLGSYPKGESRQVAMVKPGIVSVYCNMHPQMVGHVLVTPNALFTRAGSDGFYRLANVPAGKHRLAAWTPHGKVQIQEVEVPSAGLVTVELSLSRGAVRPHKDKDGKAYQTYER